MSRRSVSGWLLDLLVGGLSGALLAVIAAVNLVIYAGIERGYEASLIQVFEQRPAIGVLTILILAAGPVFGVLTARRLRRNRAHGRPVAHRR